MSSDPPIIITNGSLTIMFDTHTFVRSKDEDGKFYHPGKRIRYIEIAGAEINFVRDVPSKGRMQIRIHYGSKPSDPPIVITSGSLTIRFDTRTFVGVGGKFSHPRESIRRVEIDGDGIEFAQDIPSKSKMAIKIHYSSE